MPNKEQFKKLTARVFADLTQGLNKIYTYHSAMHVCMVYRDASFLGRKLGLSSEDLMLLQTAACFHDYGFLKSHENHEAQSCLDARRILPDYGYDEEGIDKICKMIMSTRIPQAADSILQKILCDADLFYLGGDYYFEIADLYKKELNALNKLDSEEDWRLLQIDFLEHHTYLLDYTKDLLNQTKMKNLNILKGSSQ